MGVLRVVSGHGDKRYSWDQRAVLAGNPEAVAAVREAERIFAETRARGGVAFECEGHRVVGHITVFKPTAAMILLFPAVIGG